MTIAAITLYDVSLFLHVTAVVVGFGSTFAESLMFPVALRLSNRHLPYVHRLQLAINQRLATPALAVVLVTGIYQVIEGRWSFESFWISGSFVIVIVLGGLIGAYFIPTDRRLAPMVERELAAAGEGESTLSEEYQRLARREGVAGGVAGVLIVVAIFLMVTKLGG
ncbi:MAG: DUF2269 domain-containing protein [Actinomycetota bacterium]|nr:DUF2269 domain-containing protein [Actinomycetota bacterium]